MKPAMIDNSTAHFFVFICWILNVPDMLLSLTDVLTVLLQCIQIIAGSLSIYLFYLGWRRNKKQDAIEQDSK